VTRKELVVVAGVLCFLPVLAVAQTPDPVSSARIRIGPLGLTPTLALTNAGVDNNVFNEPDQLLPKQDFTITVTPATDLWLRLGRSWLAATIREDLVYYKKFASERSANTGYKGGLVVPLNRLTLSGGGSYLNTRDRPGFEIDARVRRLETSVNGSVEILAFSRTFPGVRVERAKTNFNEAANFQALDLRRELNRTVTTAALTMRHQITPLTSLTLDVARQQDRFEYSSLRDSDSTRIAAGVKLDPFALIKGSASFGYRDFKPLSPGLAGFRGLTAAVDLSYVVMGSTRFALQGTRDVEYSYDINQPWYLQIGGTASIAQQIYGPFDVTGRVGVHRLDYQNRADVAAALSNRTDYVHSYGGGAGYSVGPSVRIGFNIDQQSRTTPVDNRGYNGLRYGISVTYGF
jgi:hypothetical protein